MNYEHKALLLAEKHGALDYVVNGHVMTWLEKGFNGQKWWKVEQRIDMRTGEASAKYVE